MPKRLVLMVCLILTLALPCPSLAQSDRMVFLLVGMDDVGKSVTGEEQFGRADAMLLVSVDLNTGDMRMISVERDYLIDMPEYFGKNKLCTTSYYAGPSFTLEKVNELFTLSVPYYAAVDIPGMGDIIEAMGGIDMEITQEDFDSVTTYNGKAMLFDAPGMQHLNGQKAIDFLRARKNDSDVARNARQRRFLEACIEKALSLNADALMEMVDAFLPYVYTNLTYNEVTTILVAILSGELTLPEEQRSPLYGSTHQTHNFHSVVVADDMNAEIEAVRAFLYD